MIELPANRNEMTDDDTLSSYLDGLLTERIAEPAEGEEEGDLATIEAEERNSSPENHDNVCPQEEDAAPDDGKESDEDLDEENLKILTFRLGRLQFAVLREQLGEILTLDKLQLSPAAADGDLIGGFPGEVGKIQVIDTARLILPGKHTGTDYHHLLVLKGGEYGIACETVTAERSIPWEQVRWREERGTRPWLLGMMKDEEGPCPLIDVLLLLEVLNA